MFVFAFKHAFVCGFMCMHLLYDNIWAFVHFKLLLPRCGCLCVIVCGFLCVIDYGFLCVIVCGFLCVIDCGFLCVIVCGFMHGLAPGDALDIDSFQTVATENTT